MWWLVNELTKDEFCVIPNRDFVIGRTIGDFQLPEEKTLSRKHAVFSYAFNEQSLPNFANPVQLTLRDESSYGSFRNTTMGTQGRQRLKKGHPEIISDGDFVLFGSMRCAFHVEFRPFVVCISCISGSNRREVISNLVTIGGYLSAEWTDNSTILIMSRITVTVKVISCLSKQCYIVSPDFLSDYTLSVQSRTQLPDPSSPKYMPSLCESQLSQSQLSFLPQPARATVFSGKCFIFLSLAQHRKLARAISLAGGESHIVEDLSEVELESRISKQSSIFIQLDKAELSQRVSTQNEARYTRIETALKTANRRLVPDSEVAFAVLHASTERYCNPALDVSTQQTTQQQQGTQPPPATQTLSFAVPETPSEPKRARTPQSSDKPSLTREKDLFALPSQPPKTEPQTYRSVVHEQTSSKLSNANQLASNVKTTDSRTESRLAADLSNSNCSSNSTDRCSVLDGLFPKKRRAAPAPRGLDKRQRTQNGDAANINESTASSSSSIQNAQQTPKVPQIFIPSSSETQNNRKTGSSKPLKEKTQQVDPQPAETGTVKHTANGKYINTKVPARYSLIPPRERATQFEPTTKLSQRRQSEPKQKKKGTRNMEFDKNAPDNDEIPEMENMNLADGDAEPENDGRFDNKTVAACLNRTMESTTSRFNPNIPRNCFYTEERSKLRDDLPLRTASTSRKTPAKNTKRFHKVWPRGLQHMEEQPVGVGLFKRSAPIRRADMVIFDRDMPTDDHRVDRDLTGFDSQENPFSSRKSAKKNSNDGARQCVFNDFAPATVKAVAGGKGVRSARAVGKTTRRVAEALADTPEDESAQRFSKAATRGARGKAKSNVFYNSDSDSDGNSGRR